MGALRQFIIRKPLAPVQNLEGRKVLVTGCSPNSIGYATAEILLNWGAEVTVTRRNKTERLITQLEGSTQTTGRVFARDLDIADAGSVRDFVEWYKQERQELDVLINCAGIHLDLLSQWKEPKLSEDGYEIQWRTNYLGTIHLTHLLLPLLERSAKNTRDARIVNVISMLHNKGSNSEFFDSVKPYNSWNAYGQSKLGLAHFTMELQRRYGESGLQAYCLHPGEVFTNVAAKGLAGNPLIEKIRNALAPIEAFFMMTPFEGAQTQVLCATASNTLGGRYYRNCKVAEPSSDCQDSEVAKRLWDTGIDWVNTL